MRETSQYSSRAIGLGVRPLFFTVQRGSLYFASELKGLLASGDVEATVDPRALDDRNCRWWLYSES